MLVHRAGSSRGHQQHDVEEHLSFLSRWGDYRDPHISGHINLGVDPVWFAIDSRRYAHVDRLRRPLRILALTHNLNREGAPLVLLDLVRAYVRDGGHAVRMLTAEDGPLRGAYEDLGVDVEVAAGMLPAPSESLAEWRSRLGSLGNRLAVASFDLVVCNTIVCCWGVELARLFGVASLWHVHEGTDVPTSLRTLFAGRPASTMRTVLEDSLAGAGRVVFQARAVAEQFQRYNRRDHHRVLRGSIGIAEIDAYRSAHSRAALRRKHGFSDSQFVVVSIGTICPRKAQHVLVDALAELTWRQALPRLRCVLVGERDDDFTKDYRRGVRQRIHQGRLEEVVQVVGETASYREFLGLADLFVLSSYSESFPRIMLEAMAFGLPLVATSVFGVPEILGHDGEGLLVEPQGRLGRAGGAPSGAVSTSRS